MTAPVVEQVKQKEKEEMDRNKVASEAASLMKSELKQSEEMKAIAALKDFASPVMKDYDIKNEKDMIKSDVLSNDKPTVKNEEKSKAPVEPPS